MWAAEKAQHLAMYACTIVAPTLATATPDPLHCISKHACQQHVGTTWLPRPVDNPMHRTPTHPHVAVRLSQSVSSMCAGRCVAWHAEGPTTAGFPLGGTSAVRQPRSHINACFRSCHPFCKENLLPQHSMRRLSHPLHPHPICSPLQLHHSAWSQQRHIALHAPRLL